MKEEEICIYILKRLKENILHTISMLRTLWKLKDNFKKYQLMQHRLDNRSRTPELYRSEDRQGGVRGQLKTATCYKCGEKGHYASQCYNKKN